jgi:hypothetical protein
MPTNNDQPITLHVYRFTPWAAPPDVVENFARLWLMHKAGGFAVDESSLCYVAGMCRVHPPLHLLSMAS